MKRYVIKGPNKGVRGTVNIEGAKNSCLPLMASSVLFEDPVIFKNVPLVRDVITMCNLLTALGSKVKISEKKKSITIINKKKQFTLKSSRQEKEEEVIQTREEARGFWSNCCRWKRQKNNNIHNK